MGLISHKVKGLWSLKAHTTENLGLNTHRVCAFRLSCAQVSSYGDGGGNSQGASVGTELGKVVAVEVGFNGVVGDVEKVGSYGRQFIPANGRGLVVLGVPGENIIGGCMFKVFGNRTIGPIAQPEPP